MSHDSTLSANSGQKSKRSLANSSSSNHSNKNSKNSKQKTLGMAWGANSLSSSRSSFRSSPFSDFGSYMAEKNRKLQNQFTSEASNSYHGGSTSGDGNLIFNGVSIFVDGFTVPSSQVVYYGPVKELRAYMLKYGGQFQNYFSRHRVTHIICSNLPDSKIKNLRSFSRGLPIVKPAWISDSVLANKLLSWVPYQLEQLANNQPKLSDFFGTKSRAVVKDGSNFMECHVNTNPSLKGGTSQNAKFEELDLVKDREQMPRLFDDADNHIEEPDSGTEKSSEIRMTNWSNTEDEHSVNTELGSPSCQFPASVNRYSFDNPKIKTSPTPSILDTSYSGHSTLEDPNFVENYFKSSRLHFIGTWRNRYRKRFPCLSSEFKYKHSHANASDNSQKNTVIHIDMDCFFVSVVIRNQPEFHDKPVAVCHSDNPKGTAEISSANYPARKYGIRAGIFVRDAKALCPHLVVVPYNFHAYEEVADQFYEVLHKHCNKVQAVSCDEAFLDITGSGGDDEDPEFLASKIRKEIFETTGCTASSGISGNMLMARLATRTAKPDGQCYIPPEQVDEYLHELPIKALPGIGHVLEERLKKQNILTCGQLRLISKESLQKDFGTKTGEMLWNYSRGIDNRPVGVIQEIKSIGAEVNWGVRFKDLQDCRHFLLKLCKEVSLRLQGCEMQGRTFTLKIKKRRKDAGEPTKFMGHGDCENLSHSMTVPVATDDVEVLQRVAKQLFGYFSLDVKDIRGVGLQVSKLENANICRQGTERNFLKSWLISASATGTTEVQRRVNSLSHERDNIAPPLLQDLDIGVIQSLPPELFSELNEIYGGKLAGFISQKKIKDDSSPRISSYEREGASTSTMDPSTSTMDPSSSELVANEVNWRMDEEAPSVEPICANLSYHEATLGPGNTDVMPSSLSQVDTSVLQQLPDELRSDILGLLPAHRRQESTAPVTPQAADVHESPKGAEHQSVSVDSVLDNDLFKGNPPLWVDKFTISNCRILNTLAETYYKSGSAGTLSSIMKQMIPRCFHYLDEIDDGGNEEASNYLCELLKQYIKLKIEFDIEELYVCFQLLRRFAKRSTFFLRVYNTVLPYLQSAFGENYGGNLNISLIE